MPRPADGSPGIVAWLIALISLVLPWAGSLCIAIGFWQIAQYGRSGAWLLIAGVALLVADVVIDVIWAHPSLTKSDLPDLNRRSNQLIGRVFVLVEAIEGGRGTVRCGDTLWQVEGPDLRKGSEVRVVGAKGMLLSVVPV